MKSLKVVGLLALMALSVALGVDAILGMVALGATPEVIATPVAVAGPVAWVTGHWIELVAGLTLLVGLARVIVKLTPTPKDDTVLQKVVDFLKHLGLVIKE